MKLTTSLAVIATALLLSGCDSSSTARQPSLILAPEIDMKKIEISMELTEPVAGRAEISVFQFLWFKFRSGDAGKVGGLTNELTVPSDYSIGNFLFGSPASCEEALAAAKYNVITTGTNDSIVETKVHATKSGFSLLGIIGYGTATAEIDGHGVVISKKNSANVKLPTVVPNGSSSGSYITVKGDSLYTIAETFLGSRERWKEISSLNPSLDITKLLSIGTTLVVPVPENK